MSIVRRILVIVWSWSCNYKNLSIYIRSQPHQIKLKIRERIPVAPITVFCYFHLGIPHATIHRFLILSLCQLQHHKLHPQELVQVLLEHKGVFESESLLMYLALSVIDYPERHQILI